MKKALFGILILFIGCATATLEQRQVAEVIQFPDMTKDQIFDKSMTWIHTQFGSGKAVMEYQDKSTGKIIGNVCIPIKIDPLGINPSVIDTNMTIDIKDGKVRMQLAAHSITFLETPVSYGSSVTAPSSREVYSGDIKKMKESFSDFKNRYTAYMKSSAGSQDW